MSSAAVSAAAVRRLIVIAVVVVVVGGRVVRVVGHAHLLLVLVDDAVAVRGLLAVVVAAVRHNARLTVAVLVAVAEAFVAAVLAL